MLDRVRMLVAPLVGVAVLLPVTRASAGGGVSCSMDDPHYDGLVSRIVDGRLEYTAKATATLAGADCPLAGRSVQITEAARFDLRGHGLRGDWAAQWDLDNDGIADLSWRGRIDAINDQTPADWNESISAQGPRGAKLTMQQRAVVDLQNRDAPLRALSAWGAASIDLKE